MLCVDCRTPFDQIVGRGRPRVRCVQCSPEQKAAPGAYRDLPGTYVKLPRRKIECAWCEEPFVATDPRRRFCSYICKVAHGNRHKQEAARDRSARPCAHCGAEFAPAYGDLRQICCSKACQNGRRSLITAGGTHRRRARRFGCEYEPINRAIVFERDGWRCKLCAIETPRTLLGARVHNAPELDHVIPLSKGGAHLYANTQCLCRSCNLFKSDRTAEELQGLLAA